MPAVRLLRMGPEHLSATLSWLQDPGLRAAIDSHGVPTVEGHAAYWAERLGSEREESYAVLLDERHVGNGGLRLDPRRGKAEAWLYVGEERARRNGVGRRAAECLLERAFRELQLTRVGVRCVSTNPDAARFWRSLGFVEEGRLRRDAGPADSIWLGMLADEWGGS